MLNVSYLDKNLNLKPRLISKQSMLYERYQYLYEQDSSSLTQKQRSNSYDQSTQQNTPNNLIKETGLIENRQNRYLMATRRRLTQKAKFNDSDSTNFFFSSFKVPKPFPKMFYNVFQLGWNSVTKTDPYLRALARYKDNQVMTAEEEDNLFKLQKERDKELGIQSTKVTRLPNSRYYYKLASYFDKIKQDQFEYAKFRASLNLSKKQLKKLDPLDEMALDMNNLAFHSHLFNEFNDLDATKVDQWYQSQANDFFSQDYCQIIGLSRSHTWILNSATNFLPLFPLLVLFEFVVFSNQETWFSLHLEDFTSTLIDVHGWQIVTFLLVSGLFITLRPIIQYSFITCFDSQTIKIILCLKMLMILCADIFLGSFDPWAKASVMTPITKIIGLAFVGYGFLTMIEAAEEDNKLRARAQEIEIVKTKFAHKSTKDAQKIENQLMFISEEMSDSLYYQAMQDLLLSQNPKSLKYLAPSIMPLRRLQDKEYSLNKLFWSGGYPRPQVELRDSTWNATFKYKASHPPHPSTFIVTRPDLDISDMLQHKVYLNSQKKKLLQQELARMHYRKAELEHTHSQLYSHALNQERSLYYDPESERRRLIQAQAQSQLNSSKNPLRQNETQSKDQRSSSSTPQKSGTPAFGGRKNESRQIDVLPPPQLTPEDIKLKLKEKQELSRKSLAGKLQNLITPVDDKTKDRAKEEEKEKARIQELLKRVEEAKEIRKQSDNRLLDSAQNTLRIGKREELLAREKEVKDKAQDLVARENLRSNLDSYKTKFPEMFKENKSYVQFNKPPSQLDQNNHLSTTAALADPNHGSWINLKARHLQEQKEQGEKKKSSKPQPQRRKLSFRSDEDELDTDHETGSKGNQKKNQRVKEREFKLQGKKQDKK